VFDEIEKGHAIMTAHDGIDEAAEEDLAEAKGPPKTPRERLAEYYAKQRAKASEPSKSLNPADDVGRCRIGNSTLNPDRARGPNSARDQGAKSQP
jgi:hypothetical protein